MSRRALKLQAIREVKLMRKSWKGETNSYLPTDCTSDCTLSVQVSYGSSPTGGKKGEN